MMVPERTLDQRLRSLAHANDVRAARARLKALVRTDETWSTALQVLAGRADEIDLGPDTARPPGYTDTMAVQDLLRAAPGLGRVKVNRLLQSQRIAASKTIAGLSDRQRDELLFELRVRARNRAATSRRFHRTTERTPT